MIYTEDSMDEKPVIIIDEKPEVIPGQDEGETPIIIIENEKDEDGEAVAAAVKPRRRLPWIVGTAVFTMLLCAAAVFGYLFIRNKLYIGVPVSVTSEQNIAKLARPSKNIEPKIAVSSDSILGVAMNFYDIEGLKAEVTLQEPDSNDTEVYFYSRCADYGKGGEYLGSLVSEGKEMQSDVTRLGYCAMANGNVVIGVARDEDVKDYVIEQGGSFFRQFILVSKGELPPRFHLHGKVERRAIGRRIDVSGKEHLSYAESIYPETMYSFADALREFGFIDAIYITGGKCYSYYRTSDSERHDIGSVHNDWDKGIVPWIVFKKK